MPARRPLLTVAQVAERFALSPKTVRNLVHRNAIPYRKLGAGPKAPLRFDPDELDRWERRVEVAS
jgi:excisionase family DNA binding protein